MGICPPIFFRDKIKRVTRPRILGKLESLSMLKSLKVLMIREVMKVRGIKTYSRESSKLQTCFSSFAHPVLFRFRGSLGT